MKYETVCFANAIVEILKFQHYDSDVVIDQFLLNVVQLL